MNNLSLYVSSFHISSKVLLYIPQPLVGTVKGWVIDEEIKNIKYNQTLLNQSLKILHGIPKFHHL